MVLSHAPLPEYDNAIAGNAIGGNDLTSGFSAGSVAAQAPDGQGPEVFSDQTTNSINNAPSGYSFLEHVDAGWSDQPASDFNGQNPASYVVGQGNSSPLVINAQPAFGAIAASAGEATLPFATGVSAFAASGGNLSPGSGFSLSPWLAANAPLAPSVSFAPESGLNFAPESGLNALLAFVASVASYSSLSGQIGNLPPSPMGGDASPSAVTAIHSMFAAAASNVGAVPPLFVAPDNQFAANHANQAVAPTNSTGLEHSAAIVPVSSVPVALAAANHLVANSDARTAFSVPTFQTPTTGHQPAPAPFNHKNQVGPSYTAAAAQEPSSQVLETSLEPLAMRESLLAGIAVDLNAVDRALASTLDEIEKMGGGVADWLDESDVTAWATVIATVVLAGGGYGYLLQRRVAQRSAASIEEPSSWLFTHWHTSLALQ